MEIFTLQKQLDEVQANLRQAKYKYEQRQLYQLEQRENEL